MLFNLFNRFSSIYGIIDINLLDSPIWIFIFLLLNYIFFRNKAWIKGGSDDAICHFFNKVIPPFYLLWITFL